MRLMCVFTVASLRYSSAAISELLSPRAASVKISLSLAVSAEKASGSAGFGRLPSKC